MAYWVWVLKNEQIYEIFKNLFKQFQSVDKLLKSHVFPHASLSETQLMKNLKKVQQ